MLLLADTDNLLCVKLGVLKIPNHLPTNQLTFYCPNLKLCIPLCCVRCP